MSDFYFIDTHAHLYLEHFRDDIDLVIENAKKARLAAVLLPAIDRESYRMMMLLVTHYPDFCYPMIGVHPTSIKSNYREELAFVEEKLTEFPFIGIGEIGIDLYWDKTYLSEQQDAFSFQIDLAQKHNLPFIIHARDSFPEVFEVLEQKKRTFTGIFHAFSGTVADAAHAIELGFKLGIGGVVTYKKSGLDAVIQEIGIEHVVLETDAPYLTPVPHRGKRNESAYLTYTAQHLADLLDIPINQVAQTTSRNAISVFKNLNKLNP